MKLNKIAALLCAAIMLISCLVPVPPARATDPAADPGDPFVYAVDIEYGSMSFYYDYGIWNVNTMRYEASATSDNPAEGTPDGFPGWYGFDNTANRIAVINRNPDLSITVQLTYRPLTESDRTATNADANMVTGVTGVSMAVSGEGWDANNKATVDESKLLDTDKAGVIGFIQLSGEPKVGDARYSSDDMTAIGMFSLTITAWEPVTQ